MIIITIQNNTWKLVKSDVLSWMVSMSDYSN